MGDSTLAIWRRSSRSGDQGNCVEVATSYSIGVAIRDSKDPTGPVLTVSVADWRAFLRDLRTR